MSHVQLQVKPRRVRCTTSCEPPPFRFDAVQRAARRQGPALVRVPARVLAAALALFGRAIDAAFFLVVLTIWCSLHVVTWSYAFEMGPAATCFGLNCPAWLTGRMLIACAALAAVTLFVALLLRRLGHRATGTVLLVLVTFDVAALLLLAASTVS